MPSKTSLEKSLEVEDTLAWKIQRIKEAGLPVESGLADYIAFAVQNLETQKDYIASVETQYKIQKQEITKQIEEIKIKGAKFFQEAGIVKVEGVICSSITMTKEKEAVETETESKVFTPLISQAEIEELLIGLGQAEMKTVIDSKTSKYIPSKLKINARKKVAIEVSSN